MKPAKAENAVDGRVNFGLKGAGDNFDPNSNSKSIKGRKFNDTAAIPITLFFYYYGVNGKPSYSSNAVDGGVNFGRKGARVNIGPNYNGKPIECTELNNPAAIPANLLYYHYGASEKLGAFENSVDGGVNFIKGTKCNNQAAIPVTLFFYNYGANEKSSYSNNVVDGGLNFGCQGADFNAAQILMENLIRHSIPANLLQYNYGAYEEPDAFEIAVVGVVNLSHIEVGVYTDMNSEPGAAIFFHHNDSAPENDLLSCSLQQMADLPYASVVFSCHSTMTSVIYSVDLIAEYDSAAMMKVVAVFHLDTSM